MRTTSGILSYGPTLAQAKSYLRVDIDSEDTLISSLVTASYFQVCAECNRSFTPCTQSFNVFSSSGDIFLTSQTVDSVSTGSLKEFGGSWYSYFDNEYNGPLSFTVGANTTVPETIKVVQLLLVSQWFENRQPQAIGVSATPLDFTVNALCNPYKIVRP